MKHVTLTTDIRFFTACQFITAHHRYHTPPRGWKFGVAAYTQPHTPKAPPAPPKLVGIAMVARPTSRILQERGYLEITRTCTILWGVNKLLYKFVADQLPTTQLCTYTMEWESGASLRAANWQPVSFRAPRPTDWYRYAMPSKDIMPAGRWRWEPIR